MKLVTLDEMKTYLNIPLPTVTYDDFLNRELETVTEAIHGYCGRIFNEATYTQTVYADDYYQTYNTINLYLYHYPVSAIGSIDLITKDSVGTETSLSITDYRLLKKLGLINRTYQNGAKQNWLDCLSGSNRLEFVYTAGYTVIPDTIKSVVYSLVAERYNKNQLGVSLDFGSDVQRVNVPGVIGIDFDYSLNANERSSAFGMILGNYANVLDYWRSERAVIGEIRQNYVE